MPTTTNTPDQPTTAPSDDLTAAIDAARAELEALEATAPTPLPAADKPNLVDLTAGLAVLTALQTALKERIDGTRGIIEDELLALRKTTGTKSLNITIDGLGKVGSISIPETTDHIDITDPQAYAAWVEQNHPTEIEYLVKVRDSFAKAHEKQLHKDFTTGACIDPLTAEVVPGLLAVKGGEAKSMRVTVTKAEVPSILEHAAGRQIGELLPADTNVIDGELLDGAA